MMKTKEEYTKQAKLKLDKLDAHIDALEAEVTKKKVDASAAYQSRLADLKDKRRALTSKFESIKDSSSEAWENLKDGFDNIMNDVEATYRDTREAVAR